MTNHEHLEILKKGVSAWNQWRKENASEIPDLRGAYLKDASLNDANLAGADLSDANLIQAHLARANLEGADLTEALLWHASLEKANLRRAKLRLAELPWAYLPRADLTAADLSYALLQGAKLRWADLREANLNHAKIHDETDLGDANLSGADLTDADLDSAIIRRSILDKAKLVRVNLSRADLFEANLTEANLGHAILRGAFLDKANLVRVKISGADFTDSVMGWTVIGATDLREAKGLNRIRHKGPSTIGIDTMYRSQGKIPIDFLRGAGVPENFIESMHSLAGSAFDYYSCFISYSRKDQEFADRLHADLRAKGVRCWLDTEDLKIGDKFRQRIDDAIRLHDKLLVVLSETSVASSWVESEVESAFEKERGAENNTVLFPIRLDEAVMKTGKAWAAEIRRTRHMGDFSHWHDHSSYQKAFQGLLRDLQGEKGESLASS